MVHNGAMVFFCWRLLLPWDQEREPDPMEGSLLSQNVVFMIMIVIMEDSFGELEEKFS